MRFLIAAAVCAAAATAADAQPTPAPCSAPEHRQLDFWVGEWEVFNTADNVRYAGSRIEQIVGGCGISETYDSPQAPGGPYMGKSYSAFDAKDGKWHQLYVDTNGAVTWYTGALEGADMSLEAEGAKALQRMVYRPESDGSVRQIGTFSTDGGKTWQAGYDYTYRRKSE